MTLYAYRAGDGVCTPFRTNDPVIAAGLYADENGAGQVFVVAGDRLEEYDVSHRSGYDIGEASWFVEHIGPHRAPVGWERRDVDGLAHFTAERSVASHVTVPMAAPECARQVIWQWWPLPAQAAYSPGDVSTNVDGAEAEAVLRMAAHVAWGGREGGEVRRA